MQVSSEATDAVAKARVLATECHLDLGPVVGCRHITRELLKEQVLSADPSGFEYGIGLRLSATMREGWVVEFAKKLPVGMVECPSTVAVMVFDETGELELV